MPSSPQAGYITSHFSRRRRNPATGRYSAHLGTDIGSNGKPVGVHAWKAGTVVSAGWSVLSGRTGQGVLIQHGSYRSYYGHLSAVSVRIGQTVAEGQRIGTSGATGNVTGVHLHFEIHKRTAGIWIAQNPVSAAGVTLGSVPKAAAAAKPAGNLTQSVKNALSRMGLPPTIEGIKQYQRAHGLVADGYWGKITERYYKWVRAFQTYLNLISTVRPKLVVDGFHGAKTRNARRIGEKARGYNPPKEPRKR